MATPSQSPEQRELSLIGKVEMRIALADSDSKLESTLKTYLAPLLLKLTSEHVTVRNKVISVCRHVSTRTKPQSIQLPVAALVKQFKEQDSSLVRHFDLVYVQQGISRLPASEKSSLLPAIVKNISKSGKHGPTIFNLLLRLLEAFTLPLRGSKEDVDLRQHWAVDENDAAYLASWLGKFILFSPRKGVDQPGPGVTLEEASFLSVEGKEGIWDPAAGGLNLLRTKTLAARLLSSGLFNDHERFLPALFASADPASSISDVGEDMMKRALPVTDLENEDLVKQLFGLYFGEGGALRVKAPLRLKILGLLNKSTKSTTFATPIMNLVNDGIASSEMDGDVIMSNGPASNANPSREATKLRTAIFTYINFVAKYGAAETLHTIAPRLVTRLRDFIENQGWPKPGMSEDLVSRGYAYEVIGLVVRAGPRNVLIEDEHPSLDILRWLLESLARDSSGNATTVSIEESLSTVLAAMSRMQLNSEEQNILEELLIDQMSRSADLGANKRLRSTRYVVVRFANRCLPFASVKARWIDILGLGALSDRAEVREESERGLSPYWYRMLNGSDALAEAKTQDWPAFATVMAEFFPGRTVDMETESLAVAQHAHALNPSCFAHMVTFARHMFFQESLLKAAVPISVDSEWERRIDAAVSSDEKARDGVRIHIQDASETQWDPLVTLLNALFVSLTDQSSGSGSHLIEFLSLAPDTLVRKLVPNIHELIPIVRSNKHSKRMAAAQAFGILASHPASDSSNTTSLIRSLHAIAEPWSSSSGQTVNEVHGAVVALGYFFSRGNYRGNEASHGDIFDSFVKTAIDMLSNSRDSSLLEAACVAIGQLSMFGSLTPDLIGRSVPLKLLIDKLYTIAKSGNEPAILCLGQLSMVLPEQPGNEESELLYIEEQLHKLHEIKQAEVHFTVGEAFSYLTSGWQSVALATKLDIVGSRPRGPSRDATRTRVVEKVLGDCSSTKPALRKAAVMWLLCLVQFCGDQEEIQSRLPKCQAAFKRCLSDRDELVQESASRGLGLIYEKGSKSLKDDLVRDLVSSFSSDGQSQLAGNVSADTQLFEPGALPTGDGSVSTYKDIMSLASEVGDSSLVYRFMSMASSNAIWSSRAAFGRFGLSNVLSSSSVDGYLAKNSKLYPKLFRYRFDPNSGVQRSMNDIWNALVKDSSATIDKHFDAIMEDLLISILGKEWRVRQASCAAIADLVQGRALEKYEQYLERIWTQCFKVLDDIKETVRAGAATLARTLTGALTRALETDHSSTKNAATMLKHVLPFLLSNSGMESSAEEVRLFSVQTLLEIIKKSNGKTLRPFIPELVERLIGSLSSLEPEAVNYLHLNASKYNLTEQKIDDMRLSNVRSSPLMEAIERCLDLLDDEAMQKLQPKLENAMKAAVGLPSKVGSSRVLVSLSTRRLVIFRPFADAFLKTIEKVILDRNETVSSSYAVAAGYVARAASDEQILRLISFAQRLYFDPEGDRQSATPRRSITAGEILFATAKHASDRFNALAASALPFVFVAKHDPNEHVKEQFQNAWDESVGGSRSVALYLDEIVGLCGKYLDSPQWVLKHTTARATAECVNAVVAMESEVSVGAATTLWPALVKALSGKTWEGKETVLFAFVKFVESTKGYWSQRPAIASEIVKIATREAKRQNVAYQQHSVKCLGQVCLARNDLDLSETVFGIAEPLVRDQDDHEPMEVDGDQPSRKADEVKQATLAAAIEALFGSINPAVLKYEALLERTAQALGDVTALASPSAGVWRSTFASLKALFERVGHGSEGRKLGADARSGLQGVLFGPDPGTEALRLSRADCILAACTMSTLLASEMRADIEALVTDERSVTVRDRLYSALA